MLARELQEASGDLRHSRRLATQAALLAAVTATGVVVAALAAPALVIPLAAGTGLELAVVCAARYTHRERVARLALEPAAYLLPEVERYGRRQVEPGQRARLSAWIREIVAEASVPGNLYLADRVARFAHELEALARDLVQPGVHVQPASVVACRRLLTHTVESPLYNPRLSSDELKLALRRIRAGISVA
jgi:hypothetical protein